MIAGEEQPDDGQVTIDPGMTIGYFSQDVGEMSGKSAVAAVTDGVGPVSALASEMADISGMRRQLHHQRGAGDQPGDVRHYVQAAGNDRVGVTGTIDALATALECTTVRILAGITPGSARPACAVRPARLAGQRIGSG